MIDRPSAVKMNQETGQRPLGVDLALSRAQFHPGSGATETCDDAGPRRDARVKEQALLLGSRNSLVGVITDPPPQVRGGDARTLPGVVFINAGVVHRVGPSRLYVNIARDLAQLGFVAARFDLSGIGDSRVRHDGLPFEQSAVVEALEVMDWLQEMRGVHRFVLIGLCSGAVIAFRASVRDQRVVGAVLINPQGFDNSSEWNTVIMNRRLARRYWMQSLFSAESWRSALTGRIDYRHLATVLRRQLLGVVRRRSALSPIASRLASDVRTLIEREVQVSLLCSEGDASIDYLNAILGRDIRGMDASGNPTVQIFQRTDHSLTLNSSQQRLRHAVRDWATAFVGSGQDRSPRRV